MKSVQYILAAAAMVIAFAGCLRDDPAVCPVVPDAKLVSISINVPGATAAATRAVEETTINTLDVVVFTDADQFVKKVPLSPANLTQEGAYLTFKIDMAYDDVAMYRFVLLANLRSELGMQTLNASTTRQSMLANLSFAARYDSSAKTLYLPMWGETETAYAITKTTSIPTVQMIRSVARMELKVADAISSIFTANSIRVPYQYSTGRAAPLEANYHKGSRKVTAPSLFNTSLNTTATYSNPTTVMYMAEYNKTAANEFCLLVNAAYNGVNGWYKVLLRDNDGYKVDILRNFAYIVTIREVTGPGFNNWQDALNSNTYIQAEVAEWNEAPQSVVIEGNNYIDVSHPTIKLYAEQGWLDVTFSTNYTGAGDKSGAGNNFVEGLTWKWDGAAPTWIQAQVVSGGIYSKTVRLTWNATTATNNAALKITAGNMNYILRINQVTDIWLEAESVAVHMNGLYYGQMPVSSPIAWDATATGGTGLTANKFEQITFSSAENSEYVYFRPNEDPYAEYGYYVNMEFTNSEYHYTPKTAKIALYGKIPSDANCYVVPPDQVIVVRTDRVNKTSLGAVVGSSDKVSSKLIWSDNPLSTPASSVEWAFGSGRGPGALLAVKTGSAEGNATVAITTPRKVSESASLDANVIRWSWHFWVSSEKNAILYNGTGQSGRWMDRNLGAKRAGGGQDAFGLYYQFGRKDPFPGLQANTYYAPEGQKQFISANNGISSISTLASVLQNPMKIDVDHAWNGSDGLGSWNGINSYATVYDPCPAGWRIPNENEKPAESGGTNTINTGDLADRGNGEIIVGNYPYPLSFPISGRRVDGWIVGYQGQKGHFWYTNAALSTPKGFCTNIYGMTDDANYSNLSMMFSVRCVKEWIVQ